MKRCGVGRRADRAGSENPCVQWWGCGPEGATCRDCAHLRARRQSKTWYKCTLRSDLTHSDHTDQRVGWMACARFEFRATDREMGNDDASDKATTTDRAL